jgi:integrase
MIGETMIWTKIRYPPGRGPLLKRFSGSRVSEIDNGVIRAYQTARAKTVSARTVNLECKLLRVILKAAKVWGALADDFRQLKEDRRGPGRALDEAQEKLLLEVAKSRPGCDTAFYAALAAANTTMRGAELKQLRLQDVNLIDCEVVVQKSKTDAGARRIPLNDAAMWAFARLLERANALGSVEPEHYLFPRFRYRETKTPGHRTGYDPTRHQKTWRTAWRALVNETARRAGRKAAGEALLNGGGLRAAITSWKRAAAGIAGLRFHDLRHLAITKLAESEASDQTIMSIAGHLDRAMLEHYSHIRAAAKRRAVESIRSYVPDEPAGPITKRVQ